VAGPGGSSPVNFFAPLVFFEAQSEAGKSAVFFVGRGGPEDVPTGPKAFRDYRWFQ
jgi:hypothetical protein